MRYDFQENTIKLGGFKSKPAENASDIAAAQDAFLQELYAMSEPNPLNPRARILMSSIVEVHKFGRSITLKDIRSLKPGAGTAAMKELCLLADDHQVEISLYAKGYSDTPTEKLVEWYRRFGFHPEGEIDDNDGIDMRRLPKPKVTRLVLGTGMMAIDMDNDRDEEEA